MGLGCQAKQETQTVLMGLGCQAKQETQTVHA